VVGNLIDKFFQYKTLVLITDIFKINVSCLKAFAAFLLFYFSFRFKFDKAATSGILGIISQENTENSTAESSNQPV
jgi:hypothetical protein